MSKTIRGLDRSGNARVAYLGGLWLFNMRGWGEFHCRGWRPWFYPLVKQ